MQTNTILQQLEKKKTKPKQSKKKNPQKTEQLFGKVKGEYCGDWYDRRIED